MVYKPENHSMQLDFVAFCSALQKRHSKNRILKPDRYN